MPGMGHEKADIIFAALPSHLDFVARILRKLGYRVFYLALSHPGQSAQAE
jgi:hypothetical protein